MASLTLFNSFGQVLSTHVDLGSAVATGITNVIGNVNYTQVVAQGQTAQGENAPVVEEVGFAEDTALAQLTESTVQIPQNFAGLESVMVPTRMRNQLFEITEVHEMDGYVEITAVHIFYQQRQNYTLWEPNENTNYSGASAIRNVMTNALFDMKFKVASDSTDMIRGNELDFARKNIVEAFLNPESGICARYGLSMIRDNDTFYCLKDVGYDRGFVVESRKNMLGVERTESIEEIVTRVAPVGHDADGNLVWMNRNGKKYIDSPHINEYAKPKAEIYMTNLEIGRDGVTAENIQQKLYEEAKKRFDEDEADIPTVSMTVQFISLGDTEEYKQYRDLDKVYLFDVIHIKDTERGYSYGAQVIAVQHNVLTGLLESVTIGTPQPWDGVRKIGAWQVPEITGGKIRHGSIRTSELANSSVTSDKLADGSVNASHMSQSADAHFENIFAEQLYISNTSEDGLLNTRFTVTEGLIQAEVTRATGAESSLGTRITQTAEAVTIEATRATNAENSISGALTVEAGKVAMVVGTNSGGNFIKAAEIATSINEAGEGVATIDADKVMIGNEKSTTVIAGKLTASDITANFLQAKISDITLLTVNALTVAGGIAAQGTLRVSGLTTLNGSLQLGSGNSFSKCLVSAVNDNGTLKITDSSGDVVNFNGAASVDFDSEGLWSSGNKILTLTNGKTHTVSIPTPSAADWSAAYIGIQSNDPKMSVSVLVGGKSLTGTVSAGDAYDAGKSSVTLSKGSWSEGALVVTASNDKTTTVSIPASSGTEWVNTEDDKWRADLTIGGVTRHSTVKNFASIRTAGYTSAHLSGSWSGNTFTVTKVNTGSSNSLKCVVTAGITYNASTHKYTAIAYGNQSSKDTETSGEEAYNAGYNDALSDVGIPNGGTVYTGSWIGTLWSAPHQSASRYDNCVYQATGHQVSKK